jgi:hypothetical protein
MALVIMVSPRARKPDQEPGYYEAEFEGRPLCTSTQPFLDGARKLLEMGYPPESEVVMQHRGAAEWSLKSTVGFAAKLTIRENANIGPDFRPWKPRNFVSLTPPIDFNEDAAPTLHEGGLT